MLKRWIAIVLFCILTCQCTIGETINIKKDSFYQSSEKFSLTGDVAVRGNMAFGQSSLGTLNVTANVIDETVFGEAQALIIEENTSASFSYSSIKEMTGKNVSDTSWHIVSDNTSKIGEIDFGQAIKTGGIVVQKSADASTWTTVYQNTDVFANHSKEIKNFYTASRSDIGNGCYYRITIAYKTERKSKQQNFLFIDTSEYQRNWHVEIYLVYMISDEPTPDNIEATIAEMQDDATVGTGVTGYSNQTAINQSAATEPFTWGDGGAGNAAEAANVRSYSEQSGTSVEHTGYKNELNGPDYIVTNAEGVVTQIQCKYYKTASKTIGACFDNGVFRYYSDVNVPMSIEVPSDQYDQAVLLMQNRILKGQVPGVTDPQEASNIVRPGSVTYNQAVNIARAGTIESLSYDAKTGCVSAASAFGISAVVQFAVSMWNNETVDVALKNSLYTGLKVGGNAFVTSILATQLTRTGLNSLLVPGSEAIVKAIGPKAAAVIVNAGRVGLTPIYGAAAMKSAARMLRGGVIVNTISFLVFTIPDVVDLINGKISGKQLAKNAASTVGGLGGAAAGGAGGAALGSAILPGVGTVIGGIVGGVAGGMGVSIGVDAIADLIAEDDADEMVDIITVEFQNLAEEYLLNSDEADEVADSLQQMLDASALKDMYQSADHHEYARRLLEPLITSVTEKRQKVTLPSDEEITDGLVETLEEIYDMDLDTTDSEQN